MKSVMMCEVCKEPIFYNDECDEFSCPHCGEEYESWTDEDVKMIVDTMEHMISFWVWNKVLNNPDGGESS